MAEVFPTSVVPQFDYTVTQEWSTVISSFDGANEQRKQKWTFPKYHVSLTFKVLTKAELKILWDFYQSMKGSYTAFYFYTLETDDWVNMYIGTGDGTSITFDIPGKSTSTQVIYVDGVEQTSGFSLLSGGGDGSSDRVQFTSAPAAGSIITCNFTGYLRIFCRFKNDNMSREAFLTSLYRTGLDLKGLTEE